MSILAQCGYGRADKIEHALQHGVINGFIMSPFDERRSRLENSITQIASTYPNAIVLFDPQFYISTLNNSRDAFLNEYDYYANNNHLNRTHFSGPNISRYVSECLTYQHEILNTDLTYIISPTVLFDDFRDNWSQISLNMATESIENHSNLENPQPLIISLVLSENVFNSQASTDEFLDALTALDAHGFYLIIRRNPDANYYAMEPESFARLMYFCYVLSEINKFELFVGYSDWYSFDYYF